MWTIRLHPSFVHIHDQNRDGYGAAGLDVHSLLGDVLSVGWDWSCPNPIACELSPADVERVERFNLELVKASEGGECALAPVEAGSVKFASLSASHTNAMLRLLAGGCPYKGTCAEQVTVSGLLSMESLMKHDKQFHDAATSGLSWTVISQTVMREYPGLASLIEEAANTGGQIQRKEGELQMARRLFNLWKTLKAGSQGKTDFSTIRAGPQVDPPLRPYAKHMIWSKRGAERASSGRKRPRGGAHRAWYREMYVGT